MKFGYARVSKNEQSLDIQVKKLEETGSNSDSCNKALVLVLEFSINCYYIS
jgi:DNA invertase Pin-like site-specific DNA recombinase